VVTLFQRAAFTAEDAAMTAGILRVLAVALPGFVLVKIILPSFLAVERMRLPLAAVGVAMAANVLAVFLLRESLPRLAPALGVAVGAWTNALILLLAVAGRFAIRLSTWWRLAALAVATAAMGLGVAALAAGAAPLLDPARGFAGKAATLAGLCLAGVAIYLAVSRLLGAWDLAFLRRRAR
jgi:putative peptidoglycan lipid II flippase